jgi:hypothetical protein
MLRKLFKLLLFLSISIIFLIFYYVELVSSVLKSVALIYRCTRCGMRDIIIKSNVSC